MNIEVAQSAALFVFATAGCNVLPGALRCDDRMTKRPRVVASNQVTWDIYQARHTRAKWIGDVEAASAEEAISLAAKEFKQDPKRLIALRRGLPPL